MEAKFDLKIRLLLNEKYHSIWHELNEKFTKITGDYFRLKNREFDECCKNTWFSQKIKEYIPLQNYDKIFFENLKNIFSHMGGYSKHFGYIGKDKKLFYRVKLLIDIYETSFIIKEKFKHLQIIYGVFDNEETVSYTNEEYQKAVNLIKSKYFENSLIEFSKKLKEFNDESDKIYKL